GDFYCTNDDATPLGTGLVRINPDGSATPITPYPVGESDIDGLALGDGIAYMVTDDAMGSIFVYDIAGAAYQPDLVAPWPSSEIFAGGTWIGAGGGVAPDPRATFAVQKAYSDDNPMPVQITISCNTGLPLQQVYELDPDRTGNTYVEFVVTDFASGTLDCEITEGDLAAYEPTYIYWIDNQENISGDRCLFEDVEHGEVATSTPSQIHNVCFIGNTLLESEVVVTKEWIDENPEFNPVNYAEAAWSCSNIPDQSFVFQLPVLGGAVQLPVPDGTISDSGQLEFFGNPSSDSFFTFGNWDGGTMCSVTEQFVDSGVEITANGCENLLVFPGEDVACTIVNTRLYEGIPTLSQYGLGLLAMLMLMMGFVAFRRFA
ncbi:MAG: IPTL-CTERM sorting domain-containing protein, partial [Saprospiraceae bacterium]|nr:IPTL-CTERM sorting domain-containing protein [Saprospiraceae bacterium]